MNCEHEYRILHDNLETEEVRYQDTGALATISISGYALFYCMKCLDMKRKIYHD